MDVLNEEINQHHDAARSDANAAVRAMAITVIVNLTNHAIVAISELVRLGEKQALDQQDE